MLYTYISHSRTPKTYYGITFCYGDKKEVPDIIDDSHFVFCGSRQDSITPVEEKQLTAELPKPENDIESTEKPRNARGRKPKTVQPTLENLKTNESISTDEE